MDPVRLSIPLGEGSLAGGWEESFISQSQHLAFLSPAAYSSDTLCLAAHDAAKQTGSIKETSAMAST